MKFKKTLIISEVSLEAQILSLPTIKNTLLSFTGF